MSLPYLLGQTCDLFAPTKVSDGFGDPRDEWPAQPTRVGAPCRLQLRTGRENVSGRDLSIQRWQLYLLAEEEIDEHYRVRFQDGRMFEVRNVYLVYTPQGAHHHECELEVFSGAVPTNG